MSPKSPFPATKRHVTVRRPDAHSVHFIASPGDKPDTWIAADLLLIDSPTEGKEG